MARHNRSGLPDLEKQTQVAIEAEQIAQADIEETQEDAELVEQPIEEPTEIEQKRPTFVAAVSVFRKEHKAWKEDEKRDDEDQPLLKALEAVIATGREAQEEMNPEELECFQWLDKAYSDVCDNIRQGKVRIFESFLWLSWGRVSLAFRE